MRILQQCTIYRIAVFVAYTVLFVIIGGCTSTYGPNPAAKSTPDTHNPPLHPNAQQIQVVTDLIDGRTVTYYVAETPENVLKFYKVTMLADGWTEAGGTAANEIELGLINRSSSTFTLRVFVREEGDNK